MGHGSSKGSSHGPCHGGLEGAEGCDIKTTSWASVTSKTGLTAGLKVPLFKGHHVKVTVPISQQPRPVSPEKVGPVDPVAREAGQVCTIRSVAGEGPSSFRALYHLGQEVMPLTSSGSALRHAHCRRNGEAVVVKVKQRLGADGVSAAGGRGKAAFTSQAEELDWRATMEFMLNLPECSQLGRTLEVFADATSYFVVMERVAGADLFELSRATGGCMMAADVREVLLQLLKAVATLHGRGAVHRDVKLENVMVCWSSVRRRRGGSCELTPIVKLVDFDTVVPLSPVPSSSSTAADNLDVLDLTDMSPSATPRFTGTSTEFGGATPRVCEDVLGSDQYIAPEAYGGHYSAASDMFAVGVLGYRLLTGKFPYPAEFFDDKPGENVVGHPKMKQIQARVAGHEVDLDSAAVFSAEPGARSFLGQLLSAATHQRPQAIEARRSPWLRGRDQASVGPSLIGGGGDYGSAALPGCVED